MEAALAAVTSHRSAERREVPPGQIIFLNGVSSSGKTSIAEQLLLVLDTPYFHMSMDAINSMRAKRRTRELGPAALDAVLRRTHAGFHRAVAGMAQAGNDIVVDHVSEPCRLRDCLTVLAGFDVVFGGVHCPLGELERRERARGDRAEGQAAQQLQRVHEHGDYDIECDTGTQSAYECAVAIKQLLARPPTLRAFDRMRAATSQ